MTRGDLIYRMARDANTAANRQAYDAIVSAVEAEDRLSAAQAALEQAEQRNEQLRDAKETMLLDHLHQELEKEHEEAKSWQAEWTKVIKRERVLRRVIEAARSFVDDDEWQEHAEAALNPVESPPVEADPKEEP